MAKKTYKYRIYPTKRQQRIFVQQQTRTLVDQYGLIAMEALIVRSMIKNPKLAKSIADASWSLFVRVYECPQCGLIIDRDHNASKNILEQGLQAVGRHSRVIPEAPAL